MNTVACRPVAKQHLCKQLTVQQALVRDSNLGTQLSQQAEETVMRETFSGRSVSGLYKEFYLGEIEAEER
jgi:hypothetical protein